MSAPFPAQSQPGAAHVPQDVRTKGGVKPQGMVSLPARLQLGRSTLGHGAGQAGSHRPGMVSTSLQVCPHSFGH